ncbi:MAG: TrmO family methyltransferase [Anaerolineae bacterium]|jgi:tRNA-Thr(GGU) m(6)t(6)A37 methyltransferase TsaA
METRFRISAIGSVRIREGGFCIQVDPRYIPALTHLQGFSHLQIVWWAHLTDSPQDRDTLIAEKLFKKGPDQLGIFATRAPARPNPIMISTIKVTEVDFEKGVIQTHFIDADDGTPVLDIKPYFPMERVKAPRVPAWCRHWPAWQEETTTFNWQDEINLG